MSTMAVPIVRLLLLAAFLLLLALKDRVPAIARRYPVLLWGLALAALATHAQFVAAERFNTNEMYHYYVGTKYFPELGYRGLYDATVTADLEDDPASFDPGQGVRSLLSYEREPRFISLQRGRALRAGFGPGRWEAFKTDIAFFRASDGILWTMGESLQDHGYNGSPLLTAILGPLARQSFLSSPDFIRLAAWLDLALILLAGAALAIAAGSGTGALFVFLWAVNPFNDFAYTGGAYLRHLHVIALLVAFWAYGRKRPVLSGAAFAFAGLLRVFPLLFPAGLLLQNLVHRDRRALLRRHAPLYASAAIAAVLLAGTVTAVLRAPGGANPWVEFGRKLALHGRRLSVNAIGLGYLFYYGEGHNVRAVERAAEEGRKLDWSGEAARAFAANRRLYAAAAAALTLLALVVLRRGQPEDGFFAGLAFLFIFLHLAHYDGSVWCLVPFIYPGNRDALRGLAILFAAVAAACLLPEARAVPDFRYFLLSALTGLYCAVMLARRVLQFRIGRQPF